jgi:hypothetical protein
MKMKSIFDRGFKYVPSLETDVGRTFARIRRQQLKKKGLTLRSLGDGAENVVSVTGGKNAAERRSPKAL